MSVLFIDGFDNYTLLEDKWDDIYTGASIVQSAGKRGTAGLQIGSSYYSDTSYLGLDIENTDSLIVGFAYKKDLSRQPTTNNIILNKPVFAESTYTPQYASYAVDGDKSSQWIALTQGVTNWLRVYLGSIKNICGFGLELEYAYEYSWNYYGSTNNVDWSLIASESQQTSQGLVITSSGIDVNYSYIMVDITPYGGHRVRVTDFQVYEFKDGTRDDVCTTSLSFSKDNVEQCRLNLGTEDITFWYDLEDSVFFNAFDSWGENTANNFTSVTEDCMLYAENPNNNYNNTNISVGCGSNALRINRTQLKFDLSYLKTLKEDTYPLLKVTNARLYLYANGGAGGPHNVSVYRCLQDWNEQEATWNKFRSQGSYEIPVNIYTTGVVRWAGTGEVYTTIAAAVAAANHGDIIALMDETYLERPVINKWVHIVGVKEATSYDNLVYVNSGGNDTNNFIYSMGIDCPFPDPYDKTIIMENIYSRVTGNRADAISRLTNVSGTVLVNKCSLRSESGSGYLMRGVPGNTKPTTQFVNCKFYHTQYLAVDMAGNWGMYRCSLADSYSGYSLLNSTTPDPIDYVTTTTTEYGYGYGDLLIPFVLDIYWNNPGCSAVASGTISGTLEDGIYDRMIIPEDTFSITTPYGKWMYWDITDLTDMWVDGTANQYGVHIRSDNEIVNNYIYISSSTAADGLKPYLSIDYESTPSGIEIRDCMVSGTWNYIETKINFDETNGSVNVKVDEVFVLTASGIGTTVSGNDDGIDSLRIYSGDGVLTQPDEHVYSHIDDLYVCNVSGTTNNDFLGVCLVDVAYPSASGTNNDYDIRYYYDDKRHEVVDGVTYERDVITEVTIPVGALEDDGYFHSQHAFTNTDSNIDWECISDINGYEGKSFFRFNNIDIPKNATIIEAKFKFTTYASAYANYIYMDGRFENSGTPVTAPISQVDLEGRELTSIESRSSWSGDNAITLNSSGELKNSLQELVDRHDWVAYNNAINLIVGFGSYISRGAVVNLRGYGWVYGRSNPAPYLDYLPKLYVKWKVDVIYDMSEYVQSTVNGYKDTYYHDTTTTSGVTVSGMNDILAIQHNLKSKYIVDIAAENNLNCKSTVIVSGTEYYSSLIDYTVVTGTELPNSALYNNKVVTFDENPATLSPWTGFDIVNMEAGSIII